MGEDGECDGSSGRWKVDWKSVLYDDGFEEGSASTGAGGKPDEFGARRDWRRSLLVTEEGLRNPAES